MENEAKAALLKKLLGIIDARCSGCKIHDATADNEIHLVVYTPAKVASTASLIHLADEMGGTVQGSTDPENRIIHGPDFRVVFNSSQGEVLRSKQTS